MNIAKAPNMSNININLGVGSVYFKSISSPASAKAEIHHPAGDRIRTTDTISNNLNRVSVHPESLDSGKSMPE